MAKWDNFRAGRIEGFECEPGKHQSIFWDGKTPGLGLRVTAAGARSYIFETRLHGRTLRTTIGDARTWSIGRAQKEATRLKALTDQGADPRQLDAEKSAKDKAARAEAKRRELTVVDVWPRYIEARKTHWGAHHYRDHVRFASTGGTPKKRGKGVTVPGPLAPLMPIRLAELTSERIEAWLKAEAVTRPTSSAQSYRLLGAFIRWLDETPEFRGLIPEGAHTAKRVREAVPEAKAKDDCLQREQLPAWFSGVRQIGNPVIAAYLQTLMLTGARREEIAALRWRDVDFQWRSMTIRDKVEGQRTIPLTPYLSSLLAALPRRNAWVFSSPTAADGKLAEPRFAHNRVLEVAGLPHLTLHGLRRSFGSLCEWVEMPSGIAAQIMGHKPSAQAEKHYRVRSLDLLRMWHDKIEAWILEQAGVEFDPAEALTTLRTVRAV